MPKKKGKAPSKGKNLSKAGKKGKGGAKLVTAPIAALPAQKPFDAAYDITTHISQGPAAAVEPFNLQTIGKIPALKAQFIDPDGKPALPPSLTTNVEGEVLWVRVAELELYKECGALLKINEGGEGSKGFRGLKAPNNRWSQLLAAHLAFVVQQKQRITSDSGFLWEAIYPQDKLGPKISDKSRYNVKLFHQGGWVSFTIDDMVPVDAAGMPLLPVSKHPNEIWPLLLGKALLKLFDGEDLVSDGTELLHALCGWVPQQMSLADTTSDETGFHWFSELCKGRVGFGADGTVIAGIAFSSVDKPQAAEEAKTASTAPAAAEGEGEEDKRGILVESPLLNSFMVTPFKEKTHDEDEDDEVPTSGKKGKNSARGKAPKKGANRPKSAKGKGNKSGRKDAEDEGKTDEETPESVIDRIDLLDLASEKQDSMKVGDLQGVFTSIWLLYNPINFVHQHNVNQSWTDCKKLHGPSLTYVHVPTPEKAKKVAEVVEVAVAAVAVAEEAKAEAEAEPEKVVTFVKLLFSIEAHSPAVVGEGSGKGFSASVEKFTWETNESVTMVTLSSAVHRGTLELIVPAGLQCVFRVRVDSPCGHYLKLYSSHKSVMEPHSNLGPLMSSCLNLHAESNSASYSGHAPTSWFVLARTHITVQESGWDPGAPQDNGRKGSGKTRDKSAKKEKGAVVEVKSDFPTPFADEDVTYISTHMHLTESTLLPYLSIEWIDHDTLNSSRCGLLDTRALKFKPNENGYTLLVTCEAPVAAYGGNLAYTLLSSKPLASHSSEANVVTDFAGTAVPDSDYVIFRNVLSNSQSSPLQVAARVGLSDPTAGFTINIYDAADVAGIEEGGPPARPVLTQSSTGALVLPLEVARDTPRFLIEMRLDPLTQGSLSLTSEGKTNDNDNDEQKEGEGEEEREPVQWTIRCVSAAASLLAMDKTKDNEFQEIKTAWEKAQSGRAKKAKISRDQFLEEAKKLAEFKKQPIVTDVPELERRTLPEEDKQSVRDFRTKEDERAQALLAKIIQIREKEIEDGISSTELRAKEFAEWRAGALTTAQAESIDRSAYRESMLSHDELLGVLKEALEQPCPTVYDIESSRPVSRKGRKPTMGTGISMSTYVETITQAVKGVESIPKWKTEALVNQAYSCVHSTALDALKEALRVAFEPQPVEESGGKKKKGNDDKPNSLGLVLCAVEHARTLEGEQTTFEVAAWIERSERHMHETYIASFEPIFNPPDEDEPADLMDPDVIEALEEVLSKVQGLNRNLSPDEAGTVNKVKSAITSYKEMLADNDGVTPEPKSGRKLKSGKKKSAR